MKTKQSFTLAATLGMLLAASAARATIYSYTFNSGFANGGVIADANTAGWTDSEAINTGDPGNIQGLTVHLNLSGGYNGDLYGYLVMTDPNSHTTLAFSTLLNRVGTGSGSEPQFSFGYADAGMNVSFSDSGANGSIHNYQNVGGYQSLLTSGGAFQTDGGSLAAFNGQSANNTWTLFIADQSGGSVSTVVSWGIDIDIVPEPVTWAMIGFAGLVVLVKGASLMRRRQVAAV